MTKQLSTALFESEDKKIMVVCHADVSYGTLHDFLLNLKGQVVDRMIAHQKQEEEVASIKKQEESAE